ncbi:MAG: hypothetical protein ACRC6M_18570 [Microcystaceae cyanobacterium]
MNKFIIAIGLGVIIASSLSINTCVMAGEGMARASGSSQIMLMTGASYSVNVEMTAPRGTYFQSGTLTVTPVLANNKNLSSNNTVFDYLVLSPGSLSVVPASSSFTTTAAAALNKATTLSDVVSIIRAGSGINGLD